MANCKKSKAKLQLNNQSSGFETTQVNKKKEEGKNKINHSLSAIFFLNEFRKHKMVPYFCSVIR